MRRAALGCAAGAFAVLAAAGPATADRGDLDPGFGHRGFAKVPRLAAAADVAIVRDGRTVVAGTTGAGSPALVELTRKGDVRHAFGSSGVAAVTGDGGPTELERDAEGRMLVVTPLGTGSRISRYTGDGQPDSTFGHGSGYVDFAEAVHSVAVDSQGRLIVATRSAVMRRVDDGGPDLSWPAGKADLLDSQSISVTVAKAVPVASDNVLVGFNAGGYGPLKFLRIEGGDGSLDGSFGVVKTGADTLRDVAFDGSVAYATTRSCWRSCWGGFLEIDYLGRVTYVRDPDFYPSGPFVDADWGEATVGGGDRYGLPGAARTSTFVRVSDDGTVSPGFGADGHVYLYPRRKGVRAAGLDVLGPRAAIVTTPANKRGQGVLVARLWDGSPRSDADADGFLDGDDVCPSMPANHHLGCPRHPPVHVFAQFDQGVIDGYLNGYRACETVPYRFVRLRRHRHPKLLVRGHPDYNGKFSIDRRPRPGRYRVVTVKTYGDGTGICPRSRSRNIFIGKKNGR